MLDHPLFWWLIGLIGASLLLWALIFNPEARLRRRLRKTHSRLVSKTRRPMVRFSVRTPKEKE